MHTIDDFTYIPIDTVANDMGRSFCETYWINTLFSEWAKQQCSLRFVSKFYLSSFSGFPEIAMRGSFYLCLFGNVLGLIFHSLQLAAGLDPSEFSLPASRICIRLKLLFSSVVFCTVKTFREISTVR